MSVAINDTNYASVVEKSDKLVLIDIWAPWCQPCKIVEPVVAQVEAAFEGKLAVVKLNADEAPELTSHLGVMSLPTLRLVRGGQTVWETIGVTDQAKLTQAVSQALQGGAA
ncbi:MAG TPA: thioredoxin [Candidatus Saccharimonas sp.]|nr:thioredoxin [Candidatus Saccharimonas sp.]